MNIKLVTYLFVGLALCTSIVWGIEQISLSRPIELSTPTPDLNNAYKSKLVRTPAGVLVVVYGDILEIDPTHYVFDLKQSSERPARDVFITVCDSANSDCSEKANWSSSINISNTALRSSIETDWNADGDRTAYYGDSDNPHIFASGNHVVVTWADKFCGSDGVQRSVTYPESDNREIAMSCLYAAHATSNFSAVSDWTVDRLSDGSRDVKQDATKGLSSGAWAITWQEDPLGLQPGEGDGPGEGSSGAQTSDGSDIWYTYTANVSNAVSDIGVWTTPVRVTDNQTGFGLPDTFNPIKDIDGDPVSPMDIETGITGASRANMSLIGGSSPPNAIIAYEETKGPAGVGQSKFIRYHVFPYNKPPTAVTARAGCIVSDPFEGARRVRFVAQTNPDSESGIRFALFWRQGLYNQGGPADIMVRLGYKSAEAGSTGLNPADLDPPVDPDCYALDYAAAVNIDNAASFNISSNTLAATDANLSDSSDSNSLENARAHRAVLRGSDFYVGYIYTEDGEVAEATDLANYNFFVRHFDASNDDWGSPVNLSNITSTDINVLEPRLVGMPGNGPGCTDTANITEPENCQNKSVVVAAWGTETNVYADAGNSENLDIFITRTVDKAAHWEPVVSLATGAASQGESQIRTTPDGNRIFSVWNETENGMTDSMFSLGIPATVDSDNGSSGSSCSAGIF